MPSGTEACGSHPRFPEPSLSQNIRSKIRRSNTMDSPSQHGRPKAHRKLKESCNECGYAKVKCSKEKPQCSRCRERGLSCGYDFSSRAGRRLASARPSTSDPSSTSAPRQNTSQPQYPRQFQHYREQSFTASPSLSPTLMAHDPILMSTSASGAEMAAFGYLSSSYAGSDYSLDYMTPSASPTLSCSMDMPIDPMMEFSNLDEHEAQNFLGAAGYFEDPSAQMSPVFTPPLMMSPDTLSLSPPTPEMSVSSQQESTGSAVCHEVLRGNISCLSKMLNVLSIQERGQQVDDSGYASGASTPVHNMTSAEDAIHANRTILEAAGSTLTCHCLCTSNQLIYLLVSTGFDVMSRYAKAAACSDPVVSPSLQAFAMANAGAYPIPDIAPARLVLGELHKVVRFIDLLAQRFQELNALQHPVLLRHDSFMSGTSNVAMSNIGNISSGYKSNEMNQAWQGQVACVSDATFRSLESDLRRRLKDVRDRILVQLRSRTL